MEISGFSSKAAGVLGGTFDPIHLGHLRLGWEACSRLSLSKLFIVPCHIPPHREEPHSSAQHRLNMAHIACKNTPEFEVTDWETKNNGPSYSVKTLSHFRARFGADLPLIFIMGTDAFNGLSRWHQWQDILSLAHLWVAHRPGAALPAADTEESDLLKARQVHKASDLLKSPAGGIFLCNTTALDISSTALREQIRNGEDPRFLLPEPVRDYIRENKLYGFGKANQTHQR